MHRLFLSPDQFTEDTAHITGNDHLHLARVLRVRPGERLMLLDNAGNAFQAVVTAIEKAETTARIEDRVTLPPEPPIFLMVAQALGKGDKFEQVIQHGTEAGASAFVPVQAERSVVDIPTNRVPDRIARWQQIAKGAAEQSGRSRIADVSAPFKLAELLREQRDEGTAGLLLHPLPEAMPLSVCLRGLADRTRLLLAVGPEGGWSPAEVSAARAANMPIVSLGPRILRTETAALVAISQILYQFETNPFLEK